MKKEKKNYPSSSQITVLVRPTGLEPAQIAPWDPKSHVSTSFTTAA